MSKRKTMIAWILSGFMLLSAIVFFPSVASILMVLFAVIAAPISRLQEFWAGKRLKGWIKTALLVVLFLQP